MRKKNSKTEFSSTFKKLLVGLFLSNETCRLRKKIINEANPEKKLE